MSKLSDSKHQNKFIHASQISSFVIMVKVFVILTLKFLRRTNDATILAKINKHDLMIVGGGGTYAKWTLPFNTNLIEKIKIPIVILGAGLNHNFDNIPFGYEDLQSIKGLNSKALFCGVRDLKTQEFLKTLNCNSEVIGDVAISLRDIKIDIIFEDKLKIGLNIAYHNWSLQDKYTDKLLYSYIHFIKRLKNKHELQIFYLQHSVWEKYIAERIKDAFPEVIVCNYNAYEMKSIYKNLDLVVSMMLHSSIFAYACKTKFINIAYDVKNYAFMELINRSDDLIDVRDLEVDTLYEKSERLLSIDPSKYLQIDSQSFIKAQEEFVKKIRDTVCL